MYLEDLFGLKGKVAVVTGGARGTGKVVAQGLAKAGAKVAVLCRSGADETVSLIEKEGGEAVSIVTDVLSLIHISPSGTFFPVWGSMTSKYR